MNTTAHTAGPIAGTLAKIRLGEAVAAELGIPLADGVSVVNAVFNVITRTVTAGRPVMVSNFGTWIPVDRAERAGRNPRTGEPVTVPARQEVFFRTAPRLRELVAAADPEAATIRKATGS
jgi:nucleoid DNA-binding protein